jgi:exopolysaccharide production protein ExoZ
MRAVAALMVVAYHVLLLLLYRDISDGNFNLLAGGVDLFFIISGFVMVTSTRDRKPSFAAFMSARIVRIVPLYWFALLATTVMMMLDGETLPSLQESLMAYFFIPYTDPRNGLPVPFLGVGWTLNYEMLFYWLFGGTLVFGTLRQLFILGIVFAGLVLLRGVLAPYGAAGFRFTSPLFFEFLAGSCIASFLPRIKLAPTYSGIILISAGVLLGLIFAIFLHLPRTIAFGLPAALIVAGAVLSESYLNPDGKKLLGFLGFLGDASYSMYLFHSMAVVLALPLVGSMPFLIACATLFVIGVLAGVIAHVVVERPLLKAIRMPVKKLLTSWS